MEMIDLLSGLKNIKKGFFVEETEQVQRVYIDIVDYVMLHYPRSNADLFLDRADPFVIAQAKVHNAIVVTHERLVPPESNKVKIPNVCERFDVKYTNLYTMMRALGARFT